MYCYGDYVNNNRVILPGSHARVTTLKYRNITLSKNSAIFTAGFRPQIASISHTRLTHGGF